MATLCCAGLASLTAPAALRGWAPSRRRWPASRGTARRVTAARCSGRVAPWPQPPMPIGWKEKDSGPLPLAFNRVSSPGQALASARRGRVGPSRSAPSAPTKGEGRKGAEKSRIHPSPAVPPRRDLLHMSCRTCRFPPRPRTEACAFQQGNRTKGERDRPGGVAARGEPRGSFSVCSARPAPRCRATPRRASRKVFVPARRAA